MDNCTVYKVNDCEWNWEQQFFFLLSFIPLATFLPIWVVARFMWLPHMKKVHEESAAETYEIPYENRFPPEEAKKDNENLEGLMNNYVMETTPDGLVILRYNKKDEGFEYWADKAIAYKYLETVARKYVTIFSCGGIYINRGALLRKKLAKLEKEIEINKQKEKLDSEVSEEEEEEESVFAKLKSNKTNKPKEKTKIMRDDMVCEKSNKFMNRGKLKESLFYEKATPSSQNTMSFIDWKKCMGFGNHFTMD
jgi:hypothetical protein